MQNDELLDYLVDLDEPDRLRELRALTDAQKQEFRHHWHLWARRAQLAPAGNWRTWLILAGRGFGKTRAGAEWVRAVAQADPAARIALVGASLNEARAVMVEGESGLLEVCPPGSYPVFEPSLRRLVWPNGAQATLYSAQEPEALRGPQHSHASGPISERKLCQRDSGPDRCAAARRNRGRGEQSSDQPGRWRLLAGRLKPDR